jgi:hypothetical protein
MTDELVSTVIIWVHESVRIQTTWWTSMSTLGLGKSSSLASFVLAPFRVVEEVFHASLSLVEPVTRSWISLVDGVVISSNASVALDLLLD